MPTRIAYWTSAFEPAIEAIASEVELLRRRYRWSVAWGLNSRHLAKCSWPVGCCLHPRLHWIFRTVARAFEPCFQINHVFGSLGDWFYLQGNRSRPTLLTVAAASEPVETELLDRVDRFVVEFPDGRDQLRRLGIPGHRVHTIYPPVRLDRFLPAPPPSFPLRVLFASSPSSAQWLEARGVHLLLDVAKLRPHMRFRLLWRPWGDSLNRVKRWIVDRGLANVELVIGRCRHMERMYEQVHATMAPFTMRNHCKPAPNSVVESMAAGRPVILTHEVDLGSLVEESRAGVVCRSTSTALAEACDQVELQWHELSVHARQAAERYFGHERFLSEYEKLYRKLACRIPAKPQIRSSNPEIRIKSEARMNLTIPIKEGWPGQSTDAIAR